MNDEQKPSPEPSTVGSALNEGLGGPLEMTGCDFAQLMNFYGVSSVYALVEMQNRHIERLQSKIPSLKDEFPASPRIG